MGEACFTSNEKPTSPNNKLQHVSFLQGDTQQGGGAGDKEVPGGQGGGRQLGLPQAEDCRHLPGAQKDVEPEKEKEMETQDDNKEDSDFEVIPELSEKTSIYPTLPSEEQTRLWKTNPSQPENKDEKETAEMKDSKTHTNAEDMKGNEKEDKVEAALKTMQAMGFSDDGGWLSSLLRAKSGDVGR